MSIDMSKLGRFVAESMESIEETFSPDAELGEIMLICEIQQPDRNVTTTRYVCTDPRVFVHIGLLRTALLSAEGKD